MQYCCVLPHHSHRALLFVWRDGRWEFPVFELPLGWFPTQVNTLLRMLHEQLGIRAMVLRLFHEGGTSYVELENMSSQELSLETGRWIEQREMETLGLRWLAQQHVAQVWFQTMHLVSVSSSPVSWEQQGWFRAVFSWIDGQLKRLHYTLAGPIEQVKGAWAYSCVLRVPTTMGDLYFKAVHSTFPTEVQVIERLSQRWPLNVPMLIAGDTSRHWMLLRDFQGVPLNNASLDCWEEALSHFAVMQIGSVDLSTYWLKHGCPDFQPHMLITLLDQLQSDAATLQLTRQEVHEWQTLVPHFKKQCQQLTTYRVPSVLLHPDFHAGNIVVKREGYLYFDWGDTMIAHPFFAVVRFLEMTEVFSLPRRSQSPQKAAALLEKLRTAYLQPWMIYEPMERLWDLLVLTIQLHPLLQTLRVYQHLPYFLTPSLQPATTVSEMLRRILELKKGLSFSN